MDIEEILKSKEYQIFLQNNLTESQQDSMLLKYLINKHVNNLKFYKMTMTAIYKKLSKDGFEVSKGKRIFVSKRTVKKYYLNTK